MTSIVERTPSILLLIFILALLAAPGTSAGTNAADPPGAAGGAATAATAPVTASAWDQLVRERRPSELHSFSRFERQLLSALDPAAAERFFDGADPAAIETLGGEDLASYLANVAERAGPGAGEELTFVPVPACRIADTRFALGKLNDGEIRSYVVRGPTTDYSPQGGDPGGCGIPGLSEGIMLHNVARAALVSLKVTAPDGDGELRAWASNQPQSAVPLAGYSDQISRAVGYHELAIVRMCDEVGVDPCVFGDIRASLSRAAHLAIDVHGYFLADITEVTAGAGLLGGGAEGPVSLAVDFAGSGAADTVARSDHVHAESVPPGAIVMWSGSLAAIPAGWALCDGSNGTPDLRDRFVLGAGPGDEPGAAGGAHSYVLSEDQLAPHGHPLTIDAAGNHRHGYLRPVRQTVPAWTPNIIGGPIDWNIIPSETGLTQFAGNHSHTGTAQSTGLGAPIDNRPAFYELAFIIKL